MDKFEYTENFISNLAKHKYKLVCGVFIVGMATCLLGCDSDNKVNQYEDTDNNISVGAVNYSNDISENEVISYFDQLSSTVGNIMESDKLEEAKDQAIDIFITCVDFLFYDTEIKGYTFAELSSQAKECVINSILEIDAIIDKHLPGYKDTISSSFNMGKDWLSEKMNIILNLTKEELSEDSWNHILEVKMKITEAGTIIGDEAYKIYEKGKNSLDNWYQEFKKKQ